MILTPKHLLFAPLYWKQAKRIKQDTPSLPEAKGDRQSTRLIAGASSAFPAYQLMIVGDSSAAGVGVNTQEEALLGQLLNHIVKQPKISKNYSHINWQLQATTGHNSFDVLRRLYALPTPTKPLDLMIVVVGVNDTTQMMSVSNWLENLKEIIAIAKRKYQAKNIIFSAIPPVKNFPALPVPLNGLIADKATQLDDTMAKLCDEHDYVHYVSFNIPFKPSAHHDKTSKTIKSDSNEYFASDGFHPSELTYKVWAEQLADFITTL